ncbi:NUDIX hydrolase [[Leptolyngbya] sp. PCC 7376]|uniref:NUDIX hydrolase n=1 Tax=[Leptolyngbya] sp. PCC 7376 TaxID=111781 RepID=UPI00029F2422|nr:NUDIX domain-containing protein [[Leptolyngbya] sp. PCC 7376]AFY38104.1 NUDIX hydrolase [[Leptolyngbya] sp. PCC 7376]
MSYTYDYPKPSVTVDCVVFGLDAEHDLKIMLIQRGVEPYKGEWALPGGFVRLEESLEEAALRELKEETGVEEIFLEQLYTFGKPGRDPRDRVITVAYYALINLADYPINAQTDADDAAWYSLENLPSLAFDHDKIVTIAKQRLQGKLRYEPIGFELLPKKFTLTQLQKLYEQVLGTQLDKRNFRRKILKMDLLIKLDEMQTGVAHRAARLYSFDEQKYKALKEAGFNFEL